MTELTAQPKLDKGHSKYDIARAMNPEAASGLLFQGKHNPIQTQSWNIPRISKRLS